MVLRRFFHKKRQKDSCNEFRNLVRDFSGSSSVVFAVQQADEQNRQRSILTSESHLGFLLRMTTQKRSFRKSDPCPWIVIPSEVKRSAEIRPRLMSYHSERSETERRNRLLGAKRTANSALRKIGRQNRRRTRRQEARARACPRSALGANDDGSPNFSPYLRCARFPPSGAA